MALWPFLLLPVLAAVLAALVFYGKRRRRKRERLELRLLVGRERLLSQELEESLNKLREFAPQPMATLRQEVEAALDLLHLRLMERQAHLLNYEDLVHLQQCKIEALKETLANPAFEDLSSLPSRSPRAATPPPKDRTQLENQLLDRISRLRKG